MANVDASAGDRGGKTEAWSSLGRSPWWRQPDGDNVEARSALVETLSASALFIAILAAIALLAAVTHPLERSQDASAAEQERMAEVAP